MEGEGIMKYQNLTNCEEMVMKTIWDAERELDLSDITQRVNEAYHKEWKPQTVSTFLAKLVRKEYLRHYRKGRAFYYQILVSQKEYLGEMAERFVKFWKQENVDVFMEALKNGLFSVG